MDGKKDLATSEENRYEYEDDISMSEPVLEDDWMVDVHSGMVNIVNQSGTPIDFGTASLRVSLLVFVNNKDHGDKTMVDYGIGMWRRITTDIVSNDDDDDDKGSAIFPVTAKIPIGEHLLVLVSDPDGTSHNGDDALYELTPLSGKYVTARVRFFPRGNVPKMKLVIR
jgi:hypothetical protein